MLTADELDRMLGACIAAGCPMLLALTVVGRVDPDGRRIRWTRAVAAAFNAHQRRTAGRLLGPDAVAAAVDALARGRAPRCSSGRARGAWTRPTPT